LVCTNGLIIGHIDFEARIRHITSAPAIEAELVEAMKNSLELGSDYLVKFRESATRELAKPLEIISELAKRHQPITQEIATIAQGRLGGNTHYDVINALTNTANGLPLDKQLEVQEFAGFLLGHPELLDGIDSDLAVASVMAEAESIVSEFPDHWNGSGYGS
jgi:hypothetical protein